MPPWHIDKTVGIQEFKNDRSLTDEQIDTIVKWVDAGAPKGDPKDMPPRREVARRQRVELRQRSSAARRISSSSRRRTRRRRWRRTPGTSRSCRPGSPKPAGCARSRSARRRSRAARSPITRSRACSRPRTAADIRQPRRRRPATIPVHGLFMEWAVGKQGEIMRPNSGKLMLPGSRIVWDIHYSRGRRRHHRHGRARHLLLPEGPGAEVPPDARRSSAASPAATATSTSRRTRSTSAPNFHVMRKAGRVENFQPHMHLRGKAMSMEAILPNGQTQMLSMVNDFNFNWHNNYVYADDAAPLLPKGTMLKITSWHDNTTANKNNPDPDQWVGWGDRTVDEMAHAWVNITYMDDEDFKAEVEKRKAQDATTTTERSSSSSKAGWIEGDTQARHARCVFGFAVPVPAHIRVQQGDREYVRRTTRSRRASRRWVALAAGGLSLGALPSAAAGAAEGSRQGHLAGLRRLVPERGWQLHAAHRLLQSQPKETLDIPIGPNNRIEPGGPDLGQPTYFGCAGTGASSRSGCRRTSATRGSVDASWRTANARRFPSG